MKTTVRTKADDGHEYEVRIEDDGTIHVFHGGTGNKYHVTDLVPYAGGEGYCRCDTDQ